MPHSFDAAVVIGRFQPFHAGHLALVRHALELAPKALVVLGSAHRPRSPKHPFTVAERSAFIRAAMGRDAERVTFLPVRDYYDEPRWRADVEGQVAALAPNARVALVGHEKDASSHYLLGFARWSRVLLPLQGDVHATPLREAYLSAPARALSSLLDSWSAQFPEATRDFLAAFARRAEYQHLAAELKAQQAYRASWSGAPFPPVFVTVDAVVTCNDQVLLIQRGHSPGRGTWALPGGFLEIAETTLCSALRELEEETGLVLPEKARRPAASAVFDHPARSERGRTISHVFHFELNTETLPPVRGSDDAVAAEWLPRAALLEREATLFDDHFHVLDTFLNLLPR